MWVVKVLGLNEQFFVSEKLLLLEAERGALCESVGTVSGGALLLEGGMPREGRHRSVSISERCCKLEV